MSSHITRGLLKGSLLTRPAATLHLCTFRLCLYLCVDILPVPLTSTPSCNQSFDIKNRQSRDLHASNSLPSKQFGSAAFVGVTFGLLLMLTSSSMFAVLGLYDSPDEEKARGGRRPHGTRPFPQSPYVGDDEEAGLHRQRPTTPLLDSSEQDKLDALLSTLSSPDSDLGGLAMQGWRDSPNIKRKRRSAAASRIGIGTILEEEDDSF